MDAELRDLDALALENAIGCRDEISENVFWVEEAKEKLRMMAVGGDDESELGNADAVKVDVLIE